jgi:acyl-CoA dehydrogenase
VTFSRKGLFTAEQQEFRLMIREFIGKEVVPCYLEWEKLGHIPREFFRKLGDIGVMGMAIPQQYGGSGSADYRYNVILQEEASRQCVTLGTTRSQLDVWLPYFLQYTTTDQAERWFPRMAAGELLTAVAMTEPGTGSDLAGMTTRAVRDGDHYVLNGSKTFITGGYLADLVIVVARTRAAPPGNRREGLSLLVVEDGMPGFVRGRMLEKIGLKVQDTAELSFNDVRVPAANLLGQEGEAFSYLGHNLPQERMTIAVGAVAQARAAVTAATEYAKSRTVFGKELSTFQNTKFELAACLTEVEAAQALLDRALTELVNGELSAADAAMVKLFTTEMQARVVDRALQVFGGYGYILEYPIARLYTDARVTRIYGGTSEVMKVIISKSMGLLADLGLHDVGGAVAGCGAAGKARPKPLGGYYAGMGDQEMSWTRADPGYVPPEIDITRPSVARVYDAILGGKDNFAVDRAVAAEAFRALPDEGKGARHNRAVLGRAVRFMVSQGIDQFLDLGSGLPTVQNTHEIAQALNPAARVVYVDNDPSVRIHAHALLADDDSTIVVLADLREPASILESPQITSFLDFSRPMGLILNAVVHHLTDDEDPHGVVARYISAIAPGSCVQITHFSNASAEAREMEKVLQQALGRGKVRDKEEIISFFNGLEILPPGVVFNPEWRPEEPVEYPLDLGGLLMVGGVGRKP